MRVRLLVGIIVLLLAAIGTVSASNITMESFYTYGPIAAGNHGSGISADDVDGDGTVEIVTVGKAVKEPGGHAWGSLHIENYDGRWLNLEVDKVWNTSYYNYTGAKAVFIKDVDGDNVKEILTGGNVREGPAKAAQMRIWNWDNTNLTLEYSQLWADHSINDIYADDVDGDGTVEIVTVGGNTTTSMGQLRIWNWSGSGMLNLEHSIEWDTNASDDEGNVFAYGVFVDNVDGDGDKEIVTVGIFSGAETNFQLRIWNWNGTTMILEHTEEWIPDSCTNLHLSGIFVDDVDGDGDKEIVTAGTGMEEGTQKGYLGIKTWDESTLNNEKDELWIYNDSTECFDLYIEDINGDGDKEIVTLGANHVAGGGQLRGWTWNGSMLNVEWNQDWISGGWGEGNFPYSIHIADADSDSVMEILTTGRAIEPPDRSLVTIWSIERSCTSNDDCTDIEFCLKDTGDCDGTGICQRKPEFCFIPEDSDPVCGCDGETYNSLCMAHLNGVNVAYEGECVEKVPALTPIGLIALAGSLGLVAAVMIRRH